VVADDRPDQSKCAGQVTVPIRWIVGELDPAREAVSRAAAATPRGTSWWCPPATTSRPSPARPSPTRSRSS
jgi:hypothetical protein